MTSKLGGNRQKQQNKTANKSKSASSQKSDSAVVAKIKQIAPETLKECSHTLPADSDYYRLQSESHGGSNVFFNQAGSDYRFNLVDGKTGAMYLATSPETAMKEVFQNKSLIESDLDGYYMGIVTTERDLTILRSSDLIRKTSLTLHDLTTSVRQDTQYLARVAHHAGFDGMEYPSNVTTEPCFVLWHGDPSGKGIVKISQQSKLTDWDFSNGKEVADILVFELGVSVEED